MESKFAGQNQFTIKPLALKPKLPLGSTNKPLPPLPELA
jgi:hypothetical protein